MKYSPKVVSFERSPAYVHHRAMMNRRENNVVDALELMRHAVEKSPENREYQLDLAELYCEMGCYEQSSQLLLDMLVQKDAPAECYYGLALNQLGMNDMEGARRSLHLYRKVAPQGAHADDVEQLATELEVYRIMNRPADRKVNRAMRISDRACEALRADESALACRLFERALKLASEQYEMRALYGLALMLNGQPEEAKRQAEQAIAGYPPSVRALCVASQVFQAAGEEIRGREILHKVMAEKPHGMEMQLLIYALGELGMHEEVSECARLALQDSPHDWILLHVRATALYNLGAPNDQLVRFWRRILRLNPNDSVAAFFHDAAQQDTLKENPPDYNYQVPDREFERRYKQISAFIGDGIPAMREHWNREVEFRKLIRWAALSEEDSLRNVAVTVIVALDDVDAESLLRTLIFGRKLSNELRMRAIALAKMRGKDLHTLLPAEPDVQNNVLMNPEMILNTLPVGERQLLRYAAEVLESEYDEDALPQLTVIWILYRKHRGMRTDPLLHTEAAAAAIAYHYLLYQDEQPKLEELAEKFHCSQRRLLFYAKHITGVLERLEGVPKDDHP